MNKPSSVKGKAEAEKSGFSTALLDWYDRHARTLPWRVPPAKSKEGFLPDPYHVWLSEVMLQQTQVASVRDYYLKFLNAWPRVNDLAKTQTQEVMKAWAGLGYYSRARNLKKCAEIVAFERKGKFPETAKELKALPGIGDYTAAAIAAIAFGEPVPVVDGNVERVIARRYRIEKPARESKSRIKTHVENLLPGDRPGDFAQAMMDLGAGLCTPKRPACGLCPVNPTCGAFAKGDMERFPVKLQKVAKPVRKGAAFVILDNEGSVFLRKRAESGLLGGMSEIPGTDWTARKDGATGKNALPFKADWKLKGTARHSFTHFHLELEVWRVVSQDYVNAGWWAKPDKLAGEALPTVMKKAISVALPDVFKGKAE